MRGNGTELQKNPFSQNQILNYIKKSQKNLTTTGGKKRRENSETV